MKLVASVSLGFCCLAGSVLADNTLLTPQQPIFSYDGFYAGGRTGAAPSHGGADFVPKFSETVGDTGAGPFNRETGEAFSAFAGYKHLRGPYVYSAEARYSNLVDLSLGASSGLGSQEVTRVFDLQGRLGYVAGQYMFYGALGWSEANLRNDAGQQLAGQSSSADLSGMNLGVGFEFGLNENVSASAEFTYRDLDGGFGGGNPANVDLNTFGLRLGYRF